MGFGIGVGTGIGSVVGAGVGTGEDVQFNLHVLSRTLIKLAE
jgi:hypothetical protein